MSNQKGSRRTEVNDHREEHAHHLHKKGDRTHGLKAHLVGFFAGHKHDHADQIDALGSSAQGTRALKISIVGLGTTAVLQVVIVGITGSVALLADTLHNFADALTALPLWLAFTLGRRAANRRYTYGYGRAEDLAGIFILAMIALSAAVAGWEAVQRLLHPQDVHNVGWVMAAGLIGFAGNELVAIYRIRIGRQIGSAALVADGLHARTDGLTSLGVLVGAIGVALGFELADPIIGLAITLAILMVLKNAAIEIYKRLMDSVSSQLVDQVQACLAAAPGVLDVEDIRIRWIGHQMRAEAKITVDAKLNLVDAHAIAEEAHHRLLHDVPKLAEALIHTNPSGQQGHDHHAHIAHHF